MSHRQGELLPDFGNNDNINLNLFMNLNNILFVPGEEAIHLSLASPWELHQLLRNSAELLGNNVYIIDYIFINTIFLVKESKLFRVY